MKTIDTKTLNTVSGAWHGWGGYPAYGYGGGAGWANPYAQAYRAEARAAWGYQNNYLLPMTAAYLASRW